MVVPLFLFFPLPYMPYMSSAASSFTSLQPNLKDTAFILVQAGYLKDVWRCAFVCKDTHMDGRLLQCLANAPIGEKQRTWMHASSRLGHNERVCVLLDAGAKVDVKDADSMTPFHYACLNGHESVARVLIEHGADVNATNNMGWTPLHLSLIHI